MLQRYESRDRYSRTVDYSLGKYWPQRNFDHLFLLPVIQNDSVSEVERTKGDAADNCFHHPGFGLQTLLTTLISVHLLDEMLGRLINKPLY